MSVKSVSDLQPKPAVEEKDINSHDSEVGNLSQSASLDGGIRILRGGTCPSLSGQSALTYQFGINGESLLYMRLIANTGGGLFSDDWISCTSLDEFVSNKTELTSGSFKAFFPNKSVNTGGFVMAVLKFLGLIQVSELNSRWHEHVSGMTFECVQVKPEEQKDDTIEQSEPKSKRKGKEA